MAKLHQECTYNRSAPPGGRLQRHCPRWSIVYTWPSRWWSLRIIPPPPTPCFQKKTSRYHNSYPDESYKVQYPDVLHSVALSVRHVAISQNLEHQTWGVSGGLEHQTWRVSAASSDVKGQCGLEQGGQSMGVSAGWSSVGIAPWPWNLWLQVQWTMPFIKLKDKLDIPLG